MEDLKAKFLSLCDVAVEAFKVPYDEPVHLASRDGGQNKKLEIWSHFSRSYTVRALAVAYDVTGKDFYLRPIKKWADDMLTFQSKMIPKNAYYMGYCREPLSTSGTWCVCDCSEIAMGVLATAVRCNNLLEKQLYLKSVESYTNLVLDNYVGPNGGILNGIWAPFDGEWWASTAASGALFFRIYDETGNPRYLTAGLNALYWLVNLESLRSRSSDAKFSTYNAPGADNPYPASPRASGSGLFHQLHAFCAGAPHLFSKGLPLEAPARREMRFFETWCRENLLGKGLSSPFVKSGYDNRRTDGVIVNGTKFGGLPHLIYGLVRHGVFPADLASIADRQLQQFVTEIFSHDELRITEFVSFALVSMAEKISPGSVMRRSVPLHETPPLETPPAR